MKVGKTAELGLENLEKPRAASAKRVPEVGVKSDGRTNKNKQGGTE